MDVRWPPGTSEGHEPLSTPFLRLLPITGLSIAVFDVDGRQSTIESTDPVATRIEELQFELGEGPHWVALQSRAPVLVSDVTEASDSRWPVFGESLGLLPVGAIFSFPMILGAVAVGVVDMYRTRPGILSQKDYVLAIALCGTVAKRAVREALRGATGESVGTADPAPAMRREVHQATGVVLVQLNISATEAFFVLRAHAFSHGLSIVGVSQDVLAGRLDFRDLPE